MQTFQNRENKLILARRHLICQGRVIARRLPAPDPTGCLPLIVAKTLISLRELSTDFASIQISSVFFLFFFFSLFHIVRPFSLPISFLTRPHEIGLARASDKFIPAPMSMMPNQRETRGASGTFRLGSWAPADLHSAFVAPEDLPSEVL